MLYPFELRARETARILHDPFSHNQLGRLAGPCFNFNGITCLPKFWCDYARSLPKVVRLSVMDLALHLLVHFEFTGRVVQVGRRDNVVAMERGYHFVPSDGRDGLLGNARPRQAAHATAP
jgi:hypothetical protein